MCSENWPFVPAFKVNMKWIFTLPSYEQLICACLFWAHNLWISVKCDVCWTRITKFLTKLNFFFLIQMYSAEKDVAAKTKFLKINIKIAYIELGSVLRTSLTQLAGFDGWRFRLILDCLVLRSSSRSCCHSNGSVNCSGAGLFHVSRIRSHPFKQTWYLKYVPATATLLQVYPTDPGTIIKNIIMLCRL